MAKGTWATVVEYQPLANGWPRVYIAFAKTRTVHPKAGYPYRPVLVFIVMGSTNGS